MAARLPSLSPDAVPGDESDFPTTLAEVTFVNNNTNLFRSIRALKQSTLSIPNRLRSIIEDAAFVVSVANQFSAAVSKDSPAPCTGVTTTTSINDRSTDTQLHVPIIANERAGSWYVPPSARQHTLVPWRSAYFKSTDGHYGQWSFSLRRLNLHVFDCLGAHGIAILADSTRRGKSMPDAFRRTVPIWCAVWNATLFPDRTGGQKRDGTFDGLFEQYRAPGMEDSEVRIIEKHISGWVRDLRLLNLDLVALKTKLKRPMRCVWIVNGAGVLGGEDTAAEELTRSFENERQWNTLILCSASRRVHGAEMSEDGYIQGAGDDSEGWSHGLTSQLFWEHQQALLNTLEEDLSEVIEKLVVDSRTNFQAVQPVCILPTEGLYVGRNIRDLSVPESFDLVIQCNGLDLVHSTHHTMLGCRSGKLGSKDLRPQLQKAKDVALEKLTKDRDCKIFVCCEDGKDLSIGVAVMLLCVLYDDDGRFAFPDTKRTIDKQLVRRRLAWITSMKPDASPSRSTLQAVNAFLMERPP